MPSLSQRYRPSTFADITGQGHVTETLRKEIATQMLGHAYLFSGPRGVGKTTAARVFAKALNCELPKEGEPCNQCRFCTAANEGRLLDIIELDAATHTGVDTVREAIIEHVRFAPMLGKRKVYILDEAHMLSMSSWNALLKTLEEPPAYAFFILATTEWHKVPATIISRCQRFEFKRIADKEMGERLEQLAKAEGWQLEEEVKRLIVSRSEGCVRDAETLLSQIGSLGETNITKTTADLVIPPSHLPLAVGLMTHWANHQAVEALKEAQRLFEEGIPFLPLFDDLLLITRRLLGAAGQPEVVARWQQGDEDARSIATLAERFTPGELHDLALLLLERRKDVKAGVDPLFALQLVGTMVSHGFLVHGPAVSFQTPPVIAQSSPVAPIVPVPAPAPAPLYQPPVVASVASVPVASPVQEPSTAAAPVVSPSVAPIVSAASPVNFGAAAPASTELALNADGATVDLDMVRSKWNTIVSVIEEKNHSLPFILKISRPEEVRGHVLVIRFQYPFHRDKIISDGKHRRIVEECLREVMRCPTLTIDGIVGEDQERQEQRSSDMVTNILKAFGGSVMDTE